MIKNWQKGMSIVEVLMATLVMGIFILGLSSLINFSSSQSQKVTRTAMAEIDSLIAERILYNDLKNLNPSFNNIFQKDDSRSEFFDFIPDVGAVSAITAKKRRLTLSKNGSKEFIFITRDYQAGPPMLYDPTAAYHFDDPPADMRIAGTFRFVSLNKDDFVKKRIPKLWQENRLIMLDTPARVRPVLSTGLIDLDVAPRSPIFIGTIEGDFVRQAVLSQIKTGHPQFPTVVLNSPDYFLRTVPPIAGATPVIKLSAIRIVRYSTENSKTDATRVNILRQVFTGRSFGAAQVLAFNVSKLTLKRESIYQPQVFFNLDYGKETKKGGSL